MKLFVGNLPWSFDQNQLSDVFEKYGTVVSARVITDRESGRSRGFGFVEMSSREDGDVAIRALDGREVGGRELTVNEARERPPRPAYGHHN